MSSNMYRVSILLRINHIYILKHDYDIKQLLKDEWLQENCNIGFSKDEKACLDRHCKASYTFLVIEETIFIVLRMASKTRYIVTSVMPLLKYDTLKK